MKKIYNAPQIRIVSVGADIISTSTDENSIDRMVNERYSTAEDL